MNKKLENVKNYVKTHKKEVLIGVAIGVGTIALTIIGVKKFQGGKAVVDYKDPKLENFQIGKAVVDYKDPKLENFQIGVGNVTDAWREKGHSHMIISDIPVKDIGKLGDAFKETFKDLTDNNLIDVIVGFDNDYDLKA